MLLTIVYQRHQKAPGHPKWICRIQLISVRFDRGKLFRSVKTSSNIYLVKFWVFFLGETKLQNINISSKSKLCIVDTYLDIEKQDLHIINWNKYIYCKDPFLYIVMHQMEDLKLAHSEFLRSMNVMTNNNPSASQIMHELRCFFCDSVNHRLGLHNCPEVKACINEGLVAYTPQGRLARSDGLNLPRAFGSEGGIAKILRDQRGTSSQMKGKGCEPSRDLPPHMTSYAGLQFNGEDVLSEPVQSTPQAFNLHQPTSTPKLPQVNTEDAFKNRRAAPSKTKQDVEMKDEPVKAKSTLQYHFTSDIQEMYNLDKIVRDKVNKMTVQPELGELLCRIRRYFHD